jgi:hypothetical protein
VSPSGEGFKVLFRLDSPCLSLLEYKMFYREFAMQFAEKHQLVGSVDLRTCDATRACFLAHDANVYFNPEATGVCWDTYIEKEEMFEGVATTTAPPVVKPKAVLDEQKYQAVLKEINPKQTVRKADKQIFVPEEILALQSDFERICKENNWELMDLQRINYGQKVMIRQGYKYAEVNVFLGKRVFYRQISQNWCRCLFVRSTVYGIRSLLVCSYSDKPRYRPEHRFDAKLASNNHLKTPNSKLITKKICLEKNVK